MGANADVVRTGWDAFVRQDMDQAVAGVDESGEIVVPESLPWGGTYRGPDGFKEMLGKFMSNMEDFRPSPQGFLEADDDHVVVPIDVQLRTTAGNDLTGRALWLYKVKGGKIVRAELFTDTADTLRALG
jgi:ketosteroid isomerase-like protein